MDNERQTVVTRIETQEEVLEILADGLSEINFNHLSEKYGIKIREYPDRYVLNYDQIKSYSSRFQLVVQICRQLILSGDLRQILHRSFDRFYNYGEDPHTAEFDISQAICDEKLDGALIGVYFDGEKWQHCSKSMAYAEGNLAENFGGYQTFGELIDNEVDLSSIYQNGNPENSYLFELVSPFDIHITRYSETRMVLLAVRNKRTGEYLDRNVEARRIGWEHLPKEFHFSSISDVMKAVHTLPSLEEGYVCRIGDWRIKIKNPFHVAMAHLRNENNLNPRRLIELITTYEEEEYLSYFPDKRKFFEPYIQVRSVIQQFFKNEYQKYKDISSQRDFALSIRDIPFNSILFRMRKDNSIEVNEIIKGLNINQKESIYRFFLEKEN